MSVFFATHRSRNDNPSKWEEGNGFKRDGEPVKIVNSLPDDHKFYQSIVRLMRPKIGETKLEAWKTPPAIDVNAEGFDGWVYADGRAVSRTKFPDAFTAFGTRYGRGDSRTTFNIPNLTKFIKLNPGAIKTNSAAEVAFSNPIPKHTHTVTTRTRTANEYAQNAFYVYVMKEGDYNNGLFFHTDNINRQLRIHNRAQYYENIAVFGSYIPGFHAGTYHENNRIVSQDVNLTSASSKIISGVTGATGNTVEAYPAHFKMPVLIFIGRPV